MLYKTVESFMNLRKAITSVITGAFLLTSALFAEEIKGIARQVKQVLIVLLDLVMMAPKVRFSILTVGQFR